MIEPRLRSSICVGVIDRLINEFFFTICPQLQLLLSTKNLVCVANHSGIFHPHWARQHSMKVHSVARGEEFQWTSYVKAKNFKTAPSNCFSEISDDHEFPKIFTGSKVEFLCPWSPEPLIVGATVVKYCRNSKIRKKCGTFFQFQIFLNKS